MNTLPLSAPFPQPTARRQFEFNLEALRGCAALIVVVFHALVVPASLDPAYTPGSIWQKLLPGHSSVLIFFILSGYVIGLTNTKALTRHTILSYLRKRLVRLYPIYLISLFIAAAVAGFKYSAFTLLGHVLFLQDSVIPVISENMPLWSLNSEVLFYLLFIPVSYFSISPGRVCLLSLLLGLASRLLFPMPLLSSYCFGFVFWSSGLWLAQSSLFAKQYSSRWFLIALLCLFFSYESLNPFFSITDALDKRLHINFLPTSGLYISFVDLFEWPFYFYLFLRFANHKLRGDVFVLLPLLFLNFAYSAHLFLKYKADPAKLEPFIFPMFFFLIGSVILLFTRNQHKNEQAAPLPVSLLKLGGISYGIYVIHFPISVFLSRFTTFSGSGFTFSVRLALDVMLVLLTGYVLEMKIQPWFKARFSEHTPRLATASK
ncbi:acyltransferase family protein [Hymenobacter cheonanensis]|uniref:acyltransferase family protein n=1 Tax=Hymenobacter sp. CA2-7 TaxID=3063993 RepID=UPI002713BC39|nr:acyltransferase [Hymenobacter sp. CA2-7]MDO7886368.1 acyltransferase [Hymenobacter sp. CA2-7]